MDFGSSIFFSMDYDENEKISFDEFTNWDFGFNFIAEDNDRVQAFETAQIILFSLWDRNGDGDISKSEHNTSMSSDFRRADVDENAFLSEDEFLRNYIVNRAYRAALVGLR